MRRLTLLACSTAFLVLLRPPGLAAQTSPELPPDPALSTPPNALPAVAGTEAPEAPPRHTLLRRIGTGLAATVLGAGVGYFFSEVALGDWDEASGNGSISRGTWAGVGGTAAFALGFSFPIGGRGGSPGAMPRAGFPSGRAVITAREIAGSGLSTAYDVVRSLRPEWLQRRQSHYAQTQDQATIPVYLGNQLLGGLDELSTIPAQSIKEMYRYDTSQATLLWGPGNAEGAIQVITNN